MSISFLRASSLSFLTSAFVRLLYILNQLLRYKKSDELYIYKTLPFDTRLQHIGSISSTCSMICALVKNIENGRINVNVDILFNSNLFVAFFNSLPYPLFKWVSNYWIQDIYNELLRKFKYLFMLRKILDCFQVVIDEDPYFFDS
jgi:hypothetical protein